MCCLWPSSANLVLVACCDTFSHCTQRNSTSMGSQEFLCKVDCFCQIAHLHTRCMNLFVCRFPTSERVLPLPVTDIAKRGRGLLVQLAMSSQSQVNILTHQTVFRCRLAARRHDRTRAAASCSTTACRPRVSVHATPHSSRAATFCAAAAAASAVADGMQRAPCLGGASKPDAVLPSTGLP